MPTHIHSWKNIPSPALNFLTGMKFVPKKRTATAAQIYPRLSAARWFNGRGDSSGEEEGEFHWGV